MKAFLSICCMVSAASYPVLALAANLPISTARSECVPKAAEQTIEPAREHRLPAIVQSGCVTLVQKKAQNRFDVVQSAAVPIIDSLLPTSGPIGTLVTIQGARFTAKNFVQFRSEQDSFAAGSPVGSESGTSLQFQVTTCPPYQPQCPGRYVLPGPYTVAVVNENGQSNEVTFFLTNR